ncbi:MAG: peptidylprolyl isomerase [Rhodospirillales bacterium]|nr:peptidylprolyl isomerase [Alphaproteobacteria bacterium]MBL6947519.1 peptidylprolyl isomerase [Rhodospirillales bacterium]
MTKRICIFILTAFLAAQSGQLQAQESLRIAAVVNDRIISVYDLSMRLRLVMLFSGLPVTQENHARLAPQVLRTLIDDELKLQEAKRVGLKVTKKEVAEVLGRIEKTAKSAEGGLNKYLAQQNIDISVLRKQVRANIIWKDLVGGRYGRSVKVSDDEVDAVLAEINANVGKPEYRLAEIFLPVENPENDAQTLALANRLFEQIKGGANFSALAKNFSKSPTAEKGGDMGWSPAGQLEPELTNALSHLKSGQMSRPIRTLEGYTIIFLRDQRTARKFGQQDAPPATVNLQQLFIPLAKGSSPTAIDEAMNKARKAGKAAKSCKALEEAAKKFASPLSGNLGDIKVNVLGPQQKNLINGLPVKTASEPLRMPDGVMVLMVCRRDEVKTPELSEENLRGRISTKLRNERLSILARQYLRELHRLAFVEIRQ